MCLQQHSGGGFLRNEFGGPRHFKMQLDHTQLLFKMGSAQLPLVLFETSSMKTSPSSGYPAAPLRRGLNGLVSKEARHRKVDMVKEFAEEVAMHSQIVKNQINSLRVNIVSMFQSQNKDKNKDTLDACKENERSYGSIMMEKLTDTEDGRVDHALQDKTFRHPYLSVMKSHTNYWRDKDTALFILNHLYRDILEEPPLSGEETTNPSVPGSLREPITLFYERDIIAEETPLTFSDSYSIKEFSRKAKKILTSR
ncbi:hypothetical protein ZIOFF_012121 [Zingiber officinale]|uniref:DDHD domain-containing protein n=1 Tax=Zingiber officinale TaxID=94328 RepID=A0A8J5HNY8_ZINOF|nr:hypothetical protein ZIOFF_012121 [Zingiber officinale]